MSPLVSVIIPVYNTAEYLRECLGSVVNQSLQGLEIICIDDCSSDGSGAILDEYAARYENVSVHHNAVNGGAHVSRNLGISLAGGEYIGFADSDDWMEPDFFKSMYDCAVRTGADLLLNTSILKEHNNVTEPYRWLTYPFEVEGEYLTPEFSANNTHCFIFLHLYKRELLLDNNIRFSIGRNVHDDDFFHRVSSMAAKSIFAYSGPYYHYRYRTGSLMESRVLKNSLYQQMFKGLMDYYESRLNDPSFALKLYNRMLFSDITEEEYVCVKDYLNGLSPYFCNSGVWPSDFDRFSIRNILESSSHSDLMKRIGSDPWVKYHTVERLRNRMKVKVSVIIPVYNTEDFIGRCLRSICDQSLHDIEIICVNDCSTDGSLKVMKRYALEDNRIQIIDLPRNGGVSNARNVAMKAARGTYIYFIDSDDWIDPDYVEAMVSRIEESKSDTVINSHFINEYDEVSKNTRSSFPFITAEGSFIPADELQKSYPPTIWSRLYRRAFLEKNDISFPIVKGGAEDVFFAYACDLTLGSVYAFRGPAYHYYQRSSSAMHNSGRGFHYFESFSLLHSYLDSRGIPAEKVKLFYVESLIIDTEEKYDFIKAYLASIKEQIDAAPDLYNAQEHFLCDVVLGTDNYRSFISRYNPNVALSFIRGKMAGKSARLLK